MHTLGLLGNNGKFLPSGFRDGEAEGPSSPRLYPFS